MPSGVKRDSLVFLGFSAVSFAYFGWSVASHPGRILVGDGSDTQIFVWSFAWWPHAILHGINPFVTHAVYAPAGVNLVWITSVPGLALIFAPLTLAFGPVVSYNIAAVLLPALAAWTAYRLCFHLTRSVWAGLVGGYLFGFSSFVLAQQLEGHLNLTGDFVLPLVALAIVGFFRDELTGRRFAVVVAILVALQLSISTEVALTLTLMLVLGLVLAGLIVPPARRKIRALVPLLAAGYALAALIAAPFLAYAVSGFPLRGFTGSTASGTDLANLVFPTGVNGIAGSSFPSIESHFDVHESALYLGLPVLVIIVLFAWRSRRSRWSVFLVVGLVVSLLLALGPELLVDGGRIVTLPWRLAEHIPGLDNVHTPRFAEYVGLAAAVIVALWVAHTPGRVFARRYVLPVLAVAALVPAVWRPSTETQPARVAFFTDGLYKTCRVAGERLAVFPISDDADIWQAESGFGFSLAGGYLQAPVFGAKSVVSFYSDPTVFELNFYGDRGEPTMTALLAFAERHRVDRVVSVVGDGYPTRSQLARLGSVEQIGGVFVAPACGRPPLTARTPTAAVRLLDVRERAGVDIEYCLDGYSYELPIGLYPAALLRGATRAVFVAGRGLRCSPPPGDKPDGLAPGNARVPAATYRYYRP